MAHAARMELEEARQDLAAAAAAGDEALAAEVASQLALLRRKEKSGRAAERQTAKGMVSALKV